MMFTIYIIGFVLTLVLLSIGVHFWVKDNERDLVIESLVAVLLSVIWPISIIPVIVHSSIYLIRWCKGDFELR